MTRPPFEGPVTADETAAPAAQRFPGAFGATVDPAPPAPSAPRVEPRALPPETPRAAGPGPGAGMAAPSPAQPGAAAADAGGEPDSLNLARRPFVNTRPVVRVAAILWVLGAALLIANVMLFMSYLKSSRTSRTRLAGLAGDIARENGDAAELRSQLGKLELGQQNREVTFLNRKIDERTFSWSLLFDRMAKVLPDRVRLLRLRPTNVVQPDVGLGARAPARELKPPPVTLTMHCEAKDDEAMLRFVDNLFAHPAFSEPNLQNEERDESGLVRFDITVQYQPSALGAEETGGAGRPAEPGAARRGVQPGGQRARPGAAAASAGPPVAPIPAPGAVPKIGPGIPGTASAGAAPSAGSSAALGAAARGGAAQGAAAGAPPGGSVLAGAARGGVPGGAAQGAAAGAARGGVPGGAAAPGTGSPLDLSNASGPAKFRRRHHLPAGAGLMPVAPQPPPDASSPPPGGSRR